MSVQIFLELEVVVAACLLTFERTFVFLEMLATDIVSIAPVLQAACTILEKMCLDEYFVTEATLLGPVSTSKTWIVSRCRLRRLDGFFRSW